jgi:serine/threonine protein kinase
MQTIQGIRFLRDHKIVHLDIKPQNLIIARGLIVKVTDYG